MSERDLVAGFDEWKAARPWGPSVGIVLKRGALEPDDLYLASFAVPGHLRGQGIARDILAKLAELADEAGVPLTLEVSMEWESSEWLQGWYERLGFEEHPEGWGEWGPFMARPVPMPVATP